MIVEIGGDPAPKKTDAEVEAMSDGNLYHYLLSQDHFEWAKWANKKSRLGLSPEDEACLAGWFASAMCAVEDRPQADYIRARLDSEGSDASLRERA